MIPVKGNMKELDTLLASAHNLKVRVELMTLDHKNKENLSGAFVDGTVTVDDDAEVTRALDITLFDPFKQIQLDPDSPSRFSVFIADMIAVTVIIQNPQRTKQFEIPVFTGPIDKVDRDDVWLDIKCLGKESLSLVNLWRGKTFKKNQRKTTVIELILKNLVGETKLAIPNKKSRLPNDEKLNRASKPWVVARGLARSMGFQLFYDGRGVATMRKKGKRTPSFTFRARHITSVPKVGYDLKNTINAVEVLGRKPKKAKKRVQYTAVAPRSHPLSPWRLGRGGVPRYIWTQVQDDKLRTKGECKQLAHSILRDGLLAGTDVSFDGIPHPRLQEGDVVAVRTEKLNVTFAMRKFTIPLVAGDDAAYGYLRRSKPRGGARGVRVKKNKNKNRNNR